VGPEIDLLEALDDRAAFAEAEAGVGAGEEPAGAGEEPAGPAPFVPIFVPIAPGPAPARPSAKVAALVRLARGLPPEGAVEDGPVPAFVHGLLEGRRNVPRPPGAPLRVLVFTMHPETTRALAAALAEAGLPHAALAGTRARRDEAVAALRGAPPGGPFLLLVTAARDCAGLDLPELTHVVFFHRVVDRSVETQVAARGQRPGRAVNLEVVALLNEDE
jgi:superfamily II DNA/RNA helicase